MPPYIPPQVRKLAERERQVATIIYSRGACTAKQVEAELSHQISNGAVRSMLVRLVRKGILKRLEGHVGRGHQFLYLPRISPKHVKLIRLKELADHHFEGSLFNVALVALELLNAQSQIKGSTSLQAAGPQKGHALIQAARTSTDHSTLS